MAKVLKYAIGLDIAKDKLDACLAAIDEQQKVTIKSSKSSLRTDPGGFQELVRWSQKVLNKQVPLVYCMEATGVYHEQLAWFLHQHGLSVIVLVPNKARYYMRSLGLHSKDDKIDARGLAMMAAQQSLKTWRPISDELYELRQLTRLYQQLQEHRTALRNQQHVQAHSRVSIASINTTLATVLQTVEQQLKEIGPAIEQALRKDPVLWQKAGHINSVKGLGLISIATIIAETDGFALFENQAQLVCYAGYDVIRNQSGKREGKTRISKMGNGRIRRILFMPAFNVVKYNITPFCNLYQRVYARTNIKMKAYVAVQRKLLVLIYTLWKKNEPYAPACYQPVNQTTPLSTP